MQMLKQYLGPQRFWKAINRYLTRHAYGSATTDELRQSVLDATGESLPWFWSQWMYQAGHPEFQVASAYDSSARAQRPGRNDCLKDEDNHAIALAIRAERGSGVAAPISL